MFYDGKVWCQLSTILIGGMRLLNENNNWTAENGRVWRQKGLPNFLQRNCCICCLSLKGGCRCLYSCWHQRDCGVGAILALGEKRRRGRFFSPLIDNEILAIQFNLMVEMFVLTSHIKKTIREEWFIMRVREANFCRIIVYR